MCGTNCHFNKIAFVDIAKNAINRFISLFRISNIWHKLTLWSNLYTIHVHVCTSLQEINIFDIYGIKYKEIDILHRLWISICCRVVRLNIKFCKIEIEQQQIWGGVVHLIPSSAVHLWIKESLRCVHICLSVKWKWHFFLAHKIKQQLNFQVFS